MGRKREGERKGVRERSERGEGVEGKRERERGDKKGRREGV